MTGAQTQVMIVEDDESTREFMALALAKHHMGSVQASTVGEALMLLDKPPTPDALILDLMLPDAKGTVLLRRIRRDNLPIRIAVVTGAADHAQFSGLLQIPPDTIFSKPL